MEAEKLKVEIKEIEDKIYELRDLLKGKKQGLANELAEFKPGDLIEDRTGTRYVIFKVELGYSFKAGYSARKVLKNGASLHKKVTEWYCMQTPLKFISHDFK